MRIDGVISRKICEMVVQITVAGLISSHVRHHYAEAGIGVELVVLNRFLGCLEVGPVRQVALVDLLEQDSVGVHGLLLQVTHEAVAEALRDGQVPDRAAAIDALMHAVVELPTLLQAMEQGEPVGSLSALSTALRAVLAFGDFYHAAAAD